GKVVIDEVAGIWLALAAADLSLLMILLTFLLFRFLDIVKPWPIGWLDKKVKGAFGVMIDDYVAGLIAFALLIIIKGVYYGNFCAGKRATGNGRACQMPGPQMDA